MPLLRPMPLLVAMALQFLLVSLFAVGGGVNTLLPQLHQAMVHQYHWLDERSFNELLAVAQAAPGPNFLLIPLIGWRVAAWPGLFVSLVAFLTAPIAISLFVGRLLHRHPNAAVVVFRNSFRPVTGGLWIASGIVIAYATDHSLVPLLLTAAVVVLSLALDVSPLWWCLGAGLIGALFA